METGNVQETIRVVCIDDWPYRTQPWQYLVAGKPRFVAPDVDDHGVASWLVPRDVGVEMLNADRRRFKLYQTLPVEVVDASGVTVVNPWYYSFVDGNPVWYENKDNLPLSYGDGKLFAAEPEPESPADALRKKIVGATNIVTATHEIVKAVDAVFGAEKGHELVRTYRTAIHCPTAAFSKHEFPLVAQTVLKLLGKELTYEQAMDVLSKASPEK